MKPVLPKKRQKYLTNANILKAIHDSKMSYCYVMAPEYRDYDIITHDITTITYEVIEQGRQIRANRLNNELIKAAALEQDLSPKKAKQYCEDNNKLFIAGDMLLSEVVVRVMTNEHIPEIKNKHDVMVKLRTNFKPFKHYIMWDDGELIEVARSHWKGDLDNGDFSTKHGNLTDELGRIIIKFTERCSFKSNFRGYTYLDDMVGDARLQLTKNALMFDESIQTKQLNPFAYYTSIINNAFRAVLNVEKYHRDIRDELLKSSGFDPSYTKQVEDND